MATGHRYAGYTHINIVHFGNPPHGYMPPRPGYRQHGFSQYPQPGYMSVQSGYLPAGAMVPPYPGYGCISAPPEPFLSEPPVGIETFERTFEQGSLGFELCVSETNNRLDSQWLTGRHPWPNHISRAVRNYMLLHEWFTHDGRDPQSCEHLTTLFQKVKGKFRSHGRNRWHHTHDDLLMRKLRHKMGTECAIMLRDGILIRTWQDERQVFTRRLSPRRRRTRNDSIRV